MIRKDHFLTGFISGLIAPLTGFYIYYLISFRYMNLWEYIFRITELGLMAGVISLSLIANLVAFFYFIKLKTDRSARGVIGATFVYGLLIIFLKYLH